MTLAVASPGDGLAPIMGAVLALAPVRHCDRDGGQIGLQIARVRPRAEVAFLTHNTDTVRRAARTCHSVGHLLGHVVSFSERGQLHGYLFRLLPCWPFGLRLRHGSSTGSVEILERTSAPSKRDARETRARVAFLLMTFLETIAALLLSVPNLVLFPWLSSTNESLLPLVDQDVSDGRRARGSELSTCRVIPGSQVLDFLAPL
jgi:hypothetical protein